MGGVSGVIGGAIGAAVGFGATILTEGFGAPAISAEGVIGASTGNNVGDIIDGDTQPFDEAQNLRLQDMNA